MLPVPKVPTENLYKFTAIGGLVLAGGMAYFAWAGMLAANNQSLDSGTTTLEVLIRREGQLRVAAQDLGVTVKDLSYHSEAYFDTPEKKDLERKWNDLMVEAARNKGNHDSAEWNLNFHIVTTIVLSILGCLSLLFSAWGFKHWYHRVQVHQDRALATASPATVPAASGGGETMDG